MDYKEIEKAYFWMLKEFTMMGEVWFVTLSFKFNVDLPIAQRNVKEWLRRLGQVLHLKKDEIEVYVVFDYQIREVLHVHLLVKSKGLHKLNPQIWEDKWGDISTHNWTSKIHPINNTGNSLEGFCKSNKEKDEDENYEPGSVSGYLLARHSHEITQNMGFWGQRKRV